MTYSWIHGFRPSPKSSGKEVNALSSLFRVSVDCSCDLQWSPVDEAVHQVHAFAPSWMLRIRLCHAASHYLFPLVERGRSTAMTFLFIIRHIVPGAPERQLSKAKNGRFRTVRRKNTKLRRRKRAELENQIAKHESPRKLRFLVCPGQSSKPQIGRSRMSDAA